MCAIGENPRQNEREREGGAESRAEQMNKTQIDAKLGGIWDAFMAVQGTKSTADLDIGSGFKVH